MATPAERIDDLDLHLNPATKQNPQQLVGDLDILRRQASEPASGIHDFSGIKKPTDIDIDPVPLFESDENVDASDADSTSKDVQEETFPLSGEVVSYIYSLPESVPKKALLHDMEDRPKMAIVRVLGSYYKRNRLTEGEYNKILDLIEGKTEEKTKTVEAGNLVWPPPKEDIDDIEVVDLLAARESGKIERNDNQKTTEPEPSPVLDIDTKSEFKKEGDVVLDESKTDATPVPEGAEVVKSELDMARDNYARAKVEFNKKNSKYNKIKGSLEGLLTGGILSGRSKEKSPTEMELEEAQKGLDEALAAYIKEKAIKKDQIINAFEAQAEEREKSGVPLTPEEEAEMLGQIKIKLLEQAEKEWDFLQGQIVSLSSVESERFNKIKEITAKGIKIWSKVPIAARLAVAPILIGTGVGLTAGLGAGALYAGTRLGRGLGGVVGSRVAGSLYDKRADMINAEAQEKTVSSYTDENSGKSFEQREEAYMRAREEEAKRKNSQRIKRAMFMVGAGAGAGILTGLAESSLSSGGAVSASAESANGSKAPVAPRGSSFDGVIKPGRAQAVVLEAVSDKKGVGTSELDAVKASVETSPILPVTVELSPKGFLQDIHNLKAGIIKQYGDNIPEEIKTKIINKPTVEIAKEYGLYKPGDVNESAVGYAGEKLSLDDKGQLIIERVDGTKETLSSLGRDGVKMALPEIDTSTPSVPEPEKLADVPVDTEAIQTKAVPEWDSRHAPLEKSVIPDNSEIIPIVDTAKPNNLLYQIPHKNSLIDVVTDGDGKIVKIGEQTIAHERMFGDGKILVLDDVYQDDPKYKDIREAFALAFEKSASVDQIGQNPTAIEFEGGKIYIIQGLKNDPMGMKVLLNGKEIASGSMEVRGSVLGPKLKFDSSLKGGWFLDDNAYERAFKNVKKFLSIK